LVISLEHISKHFGKVKALRDVSLQVQAGTITGIIGKSGSGKTTLLRCMNRLVEPDQGRILVDGLDILSLKGPALRRLRQTMGMIFQSFSLLSHETVFDNIALPLVLEGSPRDFIAQKVKDLAQMVGLQHHLDRYPSSLSGGQKQRVAIARALVRDVKILLCDEFTSALDPQTTLEILALLRDLNQRLGITIVLITHDMSVIREICDEVHVLEEGHLVETGGLEDIFYAPKHKVTKALLNTSFERELPNALKARLTPRGSGERLVRLIFGPDSAQKPLISEMSRIFGVDFNIIGGALDHVRNATLGDLLVSFKVDDTVYAEMLAFLEQHHVRLDLLGFLR